MTIIVAASGGPVSKLSDLRGRTLALGSRDSGHAAILPVHFLEREGLVEGRDYRTLRFDSDVGKHGDTGASEVEVVRAVLDGRADAGAIGSPFWKTVRAERLVPEGALTEIWTSPPYNHCMFTSRPDLDPSLERRFARSSFRDELRQSHPPRSARRRGSASLGGAAPRRLRRLARGLRAPGVFYKRGGEVGRRVGRTPNPGCYAQLKIVARRCACARSRSKARRAAAKASASGKMSRVTKKSASSAPTGCQ